MFRCPWKMCTGESPAGFLSEERELHIFVAVDELMRIYTVFFFFFFHDAVAGLEISSCFQHVSAGLDYRVHN